MDQGLISYVCLLPSTPHHSFSSSSQSPYTHFPFSLSNKPWGLWTWCSFGLCSRFLSLNLKWTEPRDQGLISYVCLLPSTHHHSFSSYSHSPYTPFPFSVSNKPLGLWTWFSFGFCSSLHSLNLKWTEPKDQGLISYVCLLPSTPHHSFSSSSHSPYTPFPFSLSNKPWGLWTWLSFGFCSRFLSLNIKWTMDQGLISYVCLLPSTPHHSFSSSFYSLYTLSPFPFPINRGDYGPGFHLVFAVVFSAWI